MEEPGLNNEPQLLKIPLERRVEERNIWREFVQIIIDMDRKAEVGRAV
jgi:hypothetical protein